MAVETHRRRNVARRAGVALAVPALTLALLLGGCRAGARNNSNSNPPVTQGAGGSSSSDNGALRQLENADSQNQTDQQQITNAGANAGVDYSSQENPLNP